jgi:hypothetical protein
MKLKGIDLFCGSGGSGWGARKAGVDKSMLASSGNCVCVPTRVTLSESALPPPVRLQPLGSHRPARVTFAG